MLNYATQNYWRLRDENRRRDRSVLDSVSQREVARPDNSGDDEEVMKSPNTEHAIQSFAMAPDLDEMGHWLNKIVKYWRADNAAAGLSVLGHKPLPREPALHLAGVLSNTPEANRQAVLRGILNRSDPGVKLHVARQIDAFQAIGAGRTPQRTEVRRSGPAINSIGANTTLPALAVMSGGQSAGGAVQSTTSLAAKPPSGNTPWPPMPRPHPDSEQREEQRKADCAKDREEHTQLRRAIADFEGRKKAAQAKFDALKRQQDSLRQDRQVVAQDLAEARSRSTEPRETMVRCPSKLKKISPRRRPRGEDYEEMVKEGVCEVVVIDLEEKGKEYWRNVLEHQKERDIRELEAELRAIDQKTVQIDNQFAAAQAAVKQAGTDVDNLYGGLWRVQDHYDAQCGNPRELWPY